MENRMEIPKNIKIELPYNPAISLLGLCKENEHSGSKIYMHLCIHYSIIYHSQDMEAIDKWIKKMWLYIAIDTYIAINIYTHIYNEILYSYKKKEILPLAATWVDLEGTVLSEVRQRKINTIGSHLYMESEKKKKKPKWTNSKLIGRQWWRGGEKWVKRVKSYKLQL